MLPNREKVKVACVTEFRFVYLVSGSCNGKRRKELEESC